jgi:hypothetical protein
MAQHLILPLTGWANFRQWAVMEQTDAHDLKRPQQRFINRLSLVSPLVKTGRAPGALPPQMMGEGSFPGQPGQPMQVFPTRQTLERTHVTGRDPGHTIPGRPTASDAMPPLQNNPRSFGALVFRLRPHRRMEDQAVKRRHREAMGLGQSQDIARQRLRLPRSDPQRSQRKQAAAWRKLSHHWLPVFIFYVAWFH